MRENIEATATPTLAEQLGVEYKEVDGLYYPMLTEVDENEFLQLGMMMEYDRYLYNLYFMCGDLYQKAKEYEDYAWQLHDELVERLKVSRNADNADLNTMEKLHRIQDIEATAEEIINNDLYELIDSIKEQRLEFIREYREQNAE